MVHESKYLHGLLFVVASQPTLNVGECKQQDSRANFKHDLEYIWMHRILFHHIVIRKKGTIKTA